MARKRNKTSPEELLKLVESGQKKFLRYDEAQIIYSMGESSIRKYAYRAGAVYKLGSAVLINKEKLDEYLELYAVEGDF